MSCVQDTLLTMTPLSFNEMNEIALVSQQLPLIANVNQWYAFIDCQSDITQNLIVVNEAFPEATEHPLYHSSVIGESVLESFEPAVYQSFKKGITVHNHRGLNQEGLLIEQNVSPIIYNARVIGVLVLEKNIRNLHIENYNRDVINRMTSLYSYAETVGSDFDMTLSNIIEDAVFCINEASEIKYFNIAAETLLRQIGTENTAFLNLKFDKVFPDLERFIYSKHSIEMMELELNQKFYVIKKIHTSFGSEKQIFVLFKDVSKLRHTEKALTSKTVAMKEVHHRVKNNLQTIASLIRLQMRHDIPENLQVYFKDTLNRILSIASVYEIILYESSNDSADIATLLKKIGNMVMTTLTTHSNIQITYQLQSSVYLSSNQSVALAIVYNEVLQNCLKHAFHQTQHGEIKVQLSTDNQNQIILSIEDNGDGISKSSQTSFGSKIIQLIVENDLEGTLNINSCQKGTQVIVMFDVHKG
ncbi:sensor histidine kinase [Staphylococcus agnetis]|uniref:sensor histidine kinase n=1 Tax=Staphylococcus agnetis TaxID=985762 RepID=UPI0021CF67FE|nr:sensor histidine kinase [Staphylococcus agnetis]UXU59789.1 sensor histidine kinase [Staphylococcus agnetis]UXU62119.1 sensor histidine kinase [Staphylococcus agnetis]